MGKKYVKTDAAVINLKNKNSLSIYTRLHCELPILFYRFPLVEIRANNCCIYRNHTTVSYLPRLAAAEL